MDSTSSMTPSIFISAGEASGEFYGAELASALSHSPTPKAKTAELWGMGGARMAAAGVDSIVRAEDMAVMGFTEVVKHLPRIYREFRKLKRAIRERRPAVAVLIDFPEIHFRLAGEFHRLGIPVIYFVSPQLWAWKQHRIRLVQKFVERMLVIFPFEEKFYRERGVQAEFVGPPFGRSAVAGGEPRGFAAENGLDAGKTWIGILPGSRLKEIEANLPEMLEAARGLSAPRPQILRLRPPRRTPLRMTASWVRPILRSVALSSCFRWRLRSMRTSAKSWRKRQRTSVAGCVFVWSMMRRPYSITPAPPSLPAERPPSKPL